jgi:hypothetical protein
MVCESDGLPVSREEAVPLLVPTLRRRVAYRSRAFAGVGSHLVLNLALQRGDDLRHLSPEDLERWGLSPLEAFEAARANLRQRSGGAFRPLRPSSRALRSPWGDGLDGSRLAVGRVFLDLGLDGAPVVIVPRRDLAIVAGANDEDGLATLLRAAAEEPSEAFTGCPMPVVMRDRLWHDWTPPAGSALWTPYRRVTTAFLAASYAAQHDLLAAAFEMVEEEDEDALLPVSATVIDLPDGPATLTTWTRGGPASLPVTDYVSLVDASDDEADDEIRTWERIPWARVVEVCGHRLEPMPAYPPRVCVDSFPDPAELARLTDAPPSKGSKAERLRELLERDRQSMGTPESLLEALGIEPR